MSLYNRWRRNLEDFLDKHRGPAVFLAAVFLVGVVFGALAVRSLDARDVTELIHYVNLNAPGLQDPPQGSEAMLLRRAMLGHGKKILLIWLLGISVVGVLGVALLLFLRGFVAGFVVSFLAAQWGARGVLFALAGHFPQSLLEVPAILVAGMAATGFAGQIFKSWRDRRRLHNFYPALAAYSATLFVTGVVLMLAAGVESFLTPGLLKAAMTWLPVR